MQELETIARNMEYYDHIMQVFVVDVEPDLSYWNISKDALDYANANLCRYREMLLEDRNALARRAEFAYLEKIFNLKKQVWKYGWEVIFDGDGEEMHLDFFDGAMFLRNEKNSILLDRFEVDGDVLIVKNKRFKYVRSRDV